MKQKSWELYLLKMQIPNGQMKHTKFEKAITRSLKKTKEKRILKFFVTLQKIREKQIWKIQILFSSRNFISWSAYEAFFRF